MEKIMKTGFAIVQMFTDLVEKVTAFEDKNDASQHLFSLLRNEYTKEFLKTLSKEFDFCSVMQYKIDCFATALEEKNVDRAIDLYFVCLDDVLEDHDNTFVFAECEIHEKSA